MARKRVKFSLPKVKVARVFSSRALIFVLFVLTSGFLVYNFRYRLLGKFFAGKVNLDWITKSELSGQLYSRYGRQVFEELIVDSLIRQEAKGKKVEVTRQDLDNAIEKIKKTVLGEEMDLDNLLSLQGVSRQEFEKQLEVQILAQKLLSDQIDVSEEEVNTFIKENKEYLIATDESGLKAEAEEKLREQKIGEKLNTWISDLLEKAQVLRLLN